MAKPYYIRRRLTRWQVLSSGETHRVEGKRAFTIRMQITRIPWWKFWLGWYGRR